MIRNDKGLYDNVEYKYLKNDLIDWKGMLNPKYFVPNPDYFKERGLDVPQSAEGLKDNQVFVRLKGYLELLQLRGYKSVELRTITASKDYVSIICRITFIGNFETGGEERVFEQAADASFDNVTGNMQKYLSAMAANRAMSLAIRKFLNIEIASVEEVGIQKEEKDEVEETRPPMDPIPRLKHLCELKGYTLESLVEKVKKKIPKAEKWKNWEDVPAINALSLIEILSKSK